MEWFQSQFSQLMSFKEAIISDYFCWAVAFNCKKENKNSKHNNIL